MSAATMNEMDRIRRERDEARAERDALAVYVERLHSTLEPFARAWQQREPAGDHNSKGYQRKLERALLPFYSTGNVDESSLTGEHLREAARALSAPVGTASLASLIAEKQAEALESFLQRHGTPANRLRAEIDKLRHRAQDPTHD